jgi:hypothetical protein
MVKHIGSSKIQKKGYKELIPTTDCLDKPNRELSVHI